MASRTTKRSAVVVNDDPTQLVLLAGLLGKAEVEARTFEAAEDALAAMDPADPPDLIVTDLYMEGIDGWRFCRLLRSPEYAPFNEVPILVVSATFAGDHPERIATDVGADVFLPAPVDGKEFIAHARALMEGTEEHRRPSVLIVEADKAHARMLQKVFRAHGYRTGKALTARAARRRFQQTHYDVAVLDHHLPDGTGAEILDSIRSRRPDCVCVLMTSDPTPDLALDWMKRGAAAYLCKPFQPDFLMELCARARRERALLRAEDLLEARTRKLSETEERYRSLFNQSASAVYLHDLDGHLLEVNETACAQLGYTKDEFLQLTVFDIHLALENTPDLSPVELRHLWRQWQPGERHEFLGQHRRKDGSAMPVQISAGPVRVAGQTLILATIDDITERKQAEEALKEKTRLLEALSDNMFDLVALTDMEGNFTFVGASHRILGYDLDSLLGRNALELVHPEDLPSVSAAFQDFLDAGEDDRRAEYRYRCADGSYLWFETVGRFIRDENGNPTQLLLSTRDVTQRKSDESALRESEEKYRRLFETMAQGVVHHSADGRIISANPAAERILGLSSDQIRGKTSMDPRWKMILEDGTPVPGTEHPAMISLRTGQTVGPVTRGVFHPEKDAYIWLSITAIPLFEPGANAPFQSYATFIDITERKQAEEQLRLRGLVLDQITDRVTVTDLEGRITYVNEAEAYALLLGRHELIGKTIESFGEDPERGATQRQVLEQTLRDGEWRGEIVNHTADGHQVILDCRTQVIHDTAENPVALCGVSTDITERKLLEEQFRHAQKMESVGRLAGGVAHDFNNMLGVILGHAELALMSLDPTQEVRADIEEIQQAASRSADLTRQLLAFARKQAVTPQVLNLNQTIRSMLRMLRRLIGENIQLTWKSGRDLWPVKIDPSQVDQILANLCVNARDAIAGSGKITIATANASFDAEYCSRHRDVSPGQYVLLQVADTGSGIAGEMLPHLFEPFFTTKEEGQGTGLGLATVYGAVTQNNGFIRVHTEPNRGTTFNIYLPRHTAGTGAAPEEPADQPTRRGGETILLVEDEPAVLDVAAKMLRLKGYTVLTAGTPGEAIRLAETHPGPIDLLLTDVVMPEMNGRDLAKNLLALHPDIKRVFMSGYTSDAISAEGIIDEGLHFIQKPFSLGELAAKVRQALDDDT